MAAREINLVVLAPADFYTGHDLSWLQLAFTAGLQALVASRGLSTLDIAFRFEYFDDQFAKPAAILDLPDLFPRKPLPQS